MRSWPSTSVPQLPISAPPVQLYNTASQKLEPAGPTAGTARMYVCGITPYDTTHIGHAATYVAFDLLNRAWLNAGLEVNYVQNVTDIDEPLFERAQATGEDWAALGERQIELFRQDMAALRVLPPAEFVSVTESISLVIDMISELKAADTTYEVAGDTYFSVRSDANFGAISRLTTAQMLPQFAERGGDPDRPGKQDPLDALLWLLQRPGEPAWESPFGKGRPGWHIECSAIARHFLGPRFDVQGGGSDLVFPHHEMSAAQAQMAQGGEAFAKIYSHAGMVEYEGEKMSKSKGNLELVSRLREQDADPMAIRLALLAHHYRSDWEWFPTELETAQRRLKRWRAAIARPTAPVSEPTIKEVLAALADDLNAPGAIAAIDRWAAMPPDEVSDTTAGTQLRAVIDAALGIAL